jgi:hypothetical protein
MLGRGLSLTGGGPITLFLSIFGSGISEILGGIEGDRVASVQEELAVRQAMVGNATVATERALKTPEQGVFLILREPTIAHPIPKSSMLVGSGDFIGGSARDGSACTGIGESLTTGRVLVVFGIGIAGPVPLEELAVAIILAALEGGLELLSETIIGEAFQVPRRVLVHTQLLVDMTEDVFVRPIDNRKGQLKLDLKGG